MADRLKTAMAEWTCPNCGAMVTSHVSGSSGAGHRCPSTLRWQAFKRTWRSQYDKLRSSTQ